MNQDFYAGLLKPYQEGVNKLKGKQELPQIVKNNYQIVIGKLEQKQKDK